MSEVAVLVSGALLIWGFGIRVPLGGEGSPLSASPVCYFC